VTVQDAPHRDRRQAQSCCQVVGAKAEPMSFGNHLRFDQRRRSVWATLRSARPIP